MLVLGMTVVGVGDERSRPSSRVGDERSRVARGLGQETRGLDLSSANAGVPSWQWQQERHNRIFFYFLYYFFFDSLPLRHFPLGWRVGVGWGWGWVCGCVGVCGSRCAVSSHFTPYRHSQEQYARQDLFFFVITLQLHIMRMYEITRHFLFRLWIAMYPLSLSSLSLSMYICIMYVYLRPHTLVASSLISNLTVAFTQQLARALTCAERTPSAGNKHHSAQFEVKKKGGKRVVKNPWFVSSFVSPSFFSRIIVCAVLFLLSRFYLCVSACLTAHPHAQISFFLERFLPASVGG